MALLHDSTAARVGALFQLLVQDTTAQDFGLPRGAFETEALAPRRGRVKAETLVLYSFGEIQPEPKPQGRYDSHQVIYLWLASA